MLRKVFILLFRLMFVPRTAWKELSEQEDNDNGKFEDGYLYPIIGLIALFAFIGVCIFLKGFRVKEALMMLVLQLMFVYVVPLMVSSFFASKLFNIDKKQGWRMAGYASAWVYFTGLVLALFPTLHQFAFLMLLASITIVAAYPYFLYKGKPNLIRTFALGLTITVVPYLMYMGVWRWFSEFVQ